MGVQRRVVRKALSALVEEGIVSRQVGRGTFVAAQRLGQVTAFCRIWWCQWS